MIKGSGEGRVLATDVGLSFWGVNIVLIVVFVATPCSHYNTHPNCLQGIDPLTGVIIDINHPLHGTHVGTAL